MRGEYIPRIYQPLVVVLIVYCARAIGAAGALERSKATFVAVALGATLLANLSVAFGPIAHVPWAGSITSGSQLHAFLDSMDTNLARYGAARSGSVRRAKSLAHREDARLSSRNNHQRPACAASLKGASAGNRSRGLGAGADQEMIVVAVEAPVEQLRLRV